MAAINRMTPKQERFAHEYVVDLNASQAAIRAGYSKKTAYSQGQRLLKNVEVQKIIRMAQNKATDKAGVDATYVLMQAKELFERCMQEVEPVMVNGMPLLDWKGRAVYKFDSAGAARALKIMGDHNQVGAFKGTNDDDGEPIDRHWEVTIVHSSKEEYDLSQREKCIEHNP